MRGDISWSDEREQLADQHMRHALFDRNEGTYNRRNVPTHWDKKFDDPDEAFRAFSCLPHNRAAYWDFFISQNQGNWLKRASRYTNARRQFQKTLPPIYTFVILEDRDTGEVQDFVCDHFPESQYPVRRFKELYREVVTDMTKLTQFWIDGHNEDVHKVLTTAQRRGKRVHFV